MPNKHTENANARSGRAVTDHQPPQDGAHVTDTRDEPSSYAAKSWQDATLAPPAAGEMTDFFDEGDPSGGAQQGSNRTRIPEYDARRDEHGPKSAKEIRKQTGSGSPDQGTQ